RSEKLPTRWPRWVSKFLSSLFNTLLLVVPMPTNLGHRVLPCLLVGDIRRSLDFYLDVLGFTQTGYYPIESEPIRTEVRRDDVAIVLYSESARGLAETPAFTGALYV